MKEGYRELSPYTDDLNEIKLKKRLVQNNEKKIIVEKYKILLAKFLSPEKLYHYKFQFLDFGCGWGDTIKIAESFNFESYGYEIDKEKIKFLNKNKVKSVDLIKDKKLFDIIMCNQVFEHLEDPLQSAKLISDRLKPNGILIISVPNGMFMKYLINFPFLWLVKNKGFFSMNPIWFFGHINCFTRKSLIKIFENSNIKLQQISLLEYLKVLKKFKKIKDKILLLTLIIKMLLNLKTVMFFTKK